MQAEVDLIILGGMGLKHDDYLYFKDTLESGGAMAKTIMFVHTASDPVVECLMVPDISLAVAERFALKGKNVLVLLTDMTNFADAMKEISITQEQVPSNPATPGTSTRSWPRATRKPSTSPRPDPSPSSPYDHARRRRHAPCPTTPATSPRGSSTSGPAASSPSAPVAPQAAVNGKTRPDHRALMDGMIKLYAAYKDAMEKKSMGFLMTTGTGSSSSTAPSSRPG
jgi:V/A-type H+-transporting ATPase subunit B